MDIGIVLRSLKTIEPTVKMLLSRKRPSALVKEKLQQLESLVVMIPETEEVLVTVWRERLAQWWVQYDEILHQNCVNGSLLNDFEEESAKEPENLCFQATDDCKSMDLTKPKKQSEPEIQKNILPCNETCSFVGTTQSPQSSTPTKSQLYNYLDITSDPFADNEPDLEDSLSLEIKKSDVHRHLEIEFEKLVPIKTSNDIFAIKALANLVGQAKRDIVHFSKTAKLQRQIVTWATMKLTEDQKLAFQKLSTDEQLALSDLTRYLAQLISCYYKSNPIATNNGNYTGKLIPYCAFCRLSGHWKSECKTLANMSCYKCMGFGHTGKHCTDIAKRH